MRILLAVDGSPSSIQARDLVAALAPVGQVSLITAYELPVDWAGDRSGMQWVAGTEEGFRKELLVQLDQLSTPLIGRKLKVERRAVRGRSAAATPAGAA